MSSRLEKEVSAIPTRVAEGIQWLNNIRPEWKESIDQDDLHISGCNTCAIAQVFGDFNLTGHNLLSPFQLVEYGFLKPSTIVCTAGEEQRYYDKLTDEWQNAIDRLWEKEAELEPV
jgi:hypothetical protein